MEKEENQEITAEPEYEPIPPYQSSIFNWSKMLQQGIVSLLILLAFIGISRSSAERPLGLIGTHLHRALHADTDSTFGVIARQPGFDQVTRWMAKTWHEMQETAPVTTETVPLVPPVPGNVITSFGWNASAAGKDPVFHAGVDLESTAGAPVRASGSGTVQQVRQESDGLWQVWLTHVDGWRTCYGHCSEVKVRVGDTVEAGQALASTGSDKQMGALVHWEVWHGVQPVNPENYR